MYFRKENRLYVKNLLPLRQKKRTAFTLAEVLITLAIIGIVAAIILPVFIQNIKKAEYSTKLKKIYSLMNQAIILSEYENGSNGYWEKEGGIAGDIKDDEGNKDYAANADVIEDWFNKYLEPYLPVESFEKADSDNSYWTSYGQAKVRLNDGILIYLHNGNCIDLSFDLNGEKQPNEFGIDIYKFYLCSYEKCETHTWYKICGCLSTYYLAVTRDTALANCKSKASYCTSLLELDNWEYKSDYPYKLR